MDFTEKFKNYEDIFFNSGMSLPLQPSNEQTANVSFSTLAVYRNHLEI